MPADEGGLRDYRIEFVRETTDSNGDAQTPSNPAWKRYSDVVRSFEWAPSAEHEIQRGIGDYAPNDIYAAPESHEITVVYDLQRWLSSTGDAAYDGMVRDADGFLPSTHSFLAREDKTSLTAGSTVNGSTSLDSRIYTYGVGGHLSDVTITGDPGSQQPVQVELTYTFEKVRSYQVDQPSAATTLTVSSSDAGDTTQTLTIEDEGAATSEAVSLNGTTAVTTVASFSDIDALSLDAETTGDITISDGTNDLAVIYGSDTYDGIEGDLGIPALGTGSHEAAIGTSFELFRGDTLTKGGADLGYDVNSYAVSVSNNLDVQPRHDSVKQRVRHGVQDATATGTVIGENETHVAARDSLRTTKSDLVWTMTGGSITLESAVLTDMGGRTVEAEQAALALDNTFTATNQSGAGVTIA